MIKGLYEAHLPVKDINRSIQFYEMLGLELASKEEKVTFFWIDKGKSWLGLWEGEEANIPYHPSIRHLAFQVDYDDIKKAKDWLQELGISVREEFGFKSTGPIVLANVPHAHASIYFSDPDGNSLELICPIELDTSQEQKYMYLDEWEAKKRNKGR